MLFIPLNFFLIGNLYFYTNPNYQKQSKNYLFPALVVQHKKNKDFRNDLQLPNPSCELLGKVSSYSLDCQRANIEYSHLPGLPCLWPTILPCQCYFELLEDVCCLFSSFFVRYLFAVFPSVSVTLNVQSQVSSFLSLLSFKPLKLPLSEKFCFQLS